MSDLAELCAKAGFTLQPWQEDLMRFLLWLKKKHPEVEVSMLGSPRRGYNAMMRRLRQEYEADNLTQENGVISERRTNEGLHG